MNDPIFCDPLSDKVLPVIELTDSKNIGRLDEDHFYLIGDYVYGYVRRGSINKLKPGTICTIGEKNYVEQHLTANKDLYNQEYIMSQRDYNERFIETKALEDMIRNYSENYKKKNNLILSGNIKITPSGEVYMPELEPDDDPLERVTKLMLRHMKLVLNDYRGHFDKKHIIDNIKSALNGATKNMSIIKFISWCDILGLQWEISFSNAIGDIPSPMYKPVVLSSTAEYPWVDIPEETKTCFTVPLKQGEDPLKRGIKLVLDQKRIDLKDYRHKSPTPHLLNNMKSALKSNQKMTLPYCMNWVEIIDLSVSFRLYNPVDGIWYKMTGYDMTTNDTEIC